MTLTSCSPIYSSNSDQTSLGRENGNGNETESIENPEDQIPENQNPASHTYEQRYQLQSLNQKLVSNTGDGFEDLYGVRNFRVVLRGILYRGGANNVYNKYKKRDNKNPLQDEALKNLCEEGFKSSIYLYTTNFSTAAKSVSCRNFENQDNALKYQQITGLDEKNTDVFLEAFYKAIKGQGAKPIYLHCWNGWHASGLISTLALRQFCKMDADTAVQYWIENTDGNSDGYDSIKTRIRNFVPRSQFQISEMERREICLNN